MHYIEDYIGLDAVDCCRSLSPRRPFSPKLLG